MGFNTSFMLLNDHLHSLKDDPNVGTMLYEAASELSYPTHHRQHIYGYHGIQAIHCSHADNDQIVRVGGNCGKLIGFGSSIDSILKAAQALSTAEPTERRRLIRTIEAHGAIMNKYPVCDSGLTL